MFYGLKLPFNTPSHERGRLDYQIKNGQVVVFDYKEEVQNWEDTQGNKIRVKSNHPLVRKHNRDKKARKLRYLEMRYSK